MRSPALPRPAAAPPRRPARRNRPPVRRHRRPGHWNRVSTLPNVVVAYETWGRLNADRDNAVLVLHALTGDSHVVGPAGPDQPTPGWWDGLIGPGAPLDDDYFVVAANVLGGCRGTTGPSTPAPDGRPWGSRFPRTHRARPGRRRDRPGRPSRASSRSPRPSVARWAACARSNGRWCSPTGCAGRSPSPPARRFSADQIAWSAAQLAAIRADPRYAGGDYYDDAPPLAGMAVARQIAHITYRSAGELDAGSAGNPSPARTRPTAADTRCSRTSTTTARSSGGGSTRTRTWCSPRR